MKKLLALILVLVLSISVFAGCSKKDDTKQGTGSTTEQPQEEKKDELKVIDTLKIAFVPSKEPQEIITATDPLKKLLKDELVKHGYDVKNVDISVGTSYEAVGEGMEAGTTDVGFIPGGTYVLYSDGVDVLLTATRAGLSKDSENAKDWNDGKATEPKDEQVTYYRSLMIAGPSAKGKELAEKVNSGQELTADDLKSAKWGHRSPTSSSGYIYPSIYLKGKYGFTLGDVPQAVELDSYGSSIAKLADESVDIVTIYADARRDYAKKWNEEFNRDGSIWEDTQVIGVSDPIYNDTISVSKSSKIMDEEFKKALSDSFIKIGSTPEGVEVMKIYSHEGYKPAKASDYDKEREAQELLKSFN